MPWPTIILAVAVLGFMYLAASVAAAAVHRSGQRYKDRRK